MRGNNKLLMGLIQAAGVIVVIGFLSVFNSVYAQMGGGGGMGGGQGSGSGHMGNGNMTSAAMGDGMGGMMLLSGGTPYRSDGQRLQMNDAIAIANQYMNLQSAPGLALDEIEEWDYNFYVVVKETATDYKAYQIIIDKYSGTVMPEPGPNMMWNWKYGKMMNNFMGGGHPKHNGDLNMTVTPDQAVTGANQFLSQRFGPAHSYVVNGQPDMYYGFYTCDVVDAATGLKAGMLSVNGTTGQVWYHTWHGNFIQGQEFN